MVSTNDKTSSLKAEQLKALIGARHGFNAGNKSAADEWLVYFELRNGTGYGSATQYLDAFALNTWPSKKLWRVAYEVKVSRSDFLKELAQPEKRQWGMDISNEFWFVCAPGVAKKEEIPADCGLLECDAQATKLKRVVVAKQRKARAFTDAEIAAIARHAYDSAGLRSLKWSLNGQELDEASLDQLLAERQDKSFTTKVEEAAAARLEPAYKMIQNQLYRYALQLKSVGLPAPAWMEEWKPGLPQSWDAGTWAKDIALHTPELQQLAHLKQVMGGASNQVQKALAEMQRSIEAVEQLLRVQPSNKGGGH